MTDRRGSIIVVSGPAGVGKTTVCRRLLETGRFVLSVSATTRAPRGQEREGVDYFFVTRAEFEARIERGEFLEWARVHETNYYGTPRAFVLDHLAAGRHVLLNIDVQGAAQLKQQGLRLVTVFLLPPSIDALRERLVKRRDTAPDEIERRLRIAEREVAASERLYDLRVVNDDVDRVVAAILAHLDAAPPAA
jgi:guanylate kinase